MTDDDFDELIEQSSLGAPIVKQIQELFDDAARAGLDQLRAAAQQQLIAAAPMPTAERAGWRALLDNTENPDNYAAAHRRYYIRCWQLTHDGGSSDSGGGW
jgi:hypothetical protein